MALERKFCCYFWFTGWHHFSLGIHIDVSQPNLEIHIPFGFIRVGWRQWDTDWVVLNAADVANRGIGWRTSTRVP